MKNREIFVTTQGTHRSVNYYTTFQKGQSSQFQGKSASWCLSLPGWQRLWTRKRWCCWWTTWRRASSCPLGRALFNTFSAPWQGWGLTLETRKILADCLEGSRPTVLGQAKAWSASSPSSPSCRTPALPTRGGAPRMEESVCALLDLFRWERSWQHRTSVLSLGRWPGGGTSPPPGSSTAPAQGAAQQLSWELTSAPCSVLSKAPTTLKKIPSTLKHCLNHLVLHVLVGSSLPPSQLSTTHLGPAPPAPSQCPPAR